MKLRIRKDEKASPPEILLLREQLGTRRYPKRLKRDEKKGRILPELKLKR